MFRVSPLIPTTPCVVALRGVAVDGLGMSGLFADVGGVISSGYFGFMVAEDAAPAGVCDPMEGILPGMDEASGILSGPPDPKDGRWLAR